MNIDSNEILLAAFRRELLKYINPLESLVLERKTINPSGAKCKVCAKSIWSAAVSVAGCCSRECYSLSTR